MRTQCAGWLVLGWLWLSIACSSANFPCEPTLETCNRIDDDCDGITDNHLTDMVEEPCGSDEGACQSGMRRCVGGEIVCDGEIGPLPESCNQVDDDCNAVIDDLPACGCTGGAPPGTEVCNAMDDDCNTIIDDDLTACACSGGGAPAPEACNRIDDDCNAAIDDGLSGCGCAGGAPPGTEVCNAIDDDCNTIIDDGLTACACSGGGAPAPEACNRIDDDCNAAIDDGLSGCGCAGGAPPGTEVCNAIDDDCNAAIDDLAACACTGGASPGTEVCNAIDDDCNAAVDDGLTACACTGGGAPTNEICNFIDDDCDGSLDESNGLGGTCHDFGESCGGPQDCSSLLCIGDIFERFCSQACDPADSGSCPAGYRCYVGPNLDYCLRNYPECDSNADCAPTQVCTVQNADDGLSKVTECRLPLSGGAAPGGDCSSGFCANALCTRQDVCTEVCGPTDPCTGQYLGLPTTCALVTYRITPGQCARDAQCPPGYTCQTNSCRGPACSSDPECATGYVCSPTGQICTPQSFRDYLGNCSIGCTNDSECPAGRYCQPGVAADLSRLQGVCDLPYVGNPTGALCDLDGDGQRDGCDHAICVSRPAGDYCTQLCGSAADCPGGMTCNPVMLNMGDPGIFPTTICAY